jgi:hypothetical protein
MAIKEMTVAKCEESELDAVREYLQRLEEVVRDNEHLEVDEEVNKEIADVARKFPVRAFLVPLNLGILLDNYQDKESDILKHPKWIMALYERVEKLEKGLADKI